MRQSKTLDLHAERIQESIISVLIDMLVVIRTYILEQISMKTLFSKTTAAEVDGKMGCIRPRRKVNHCRHTCV